MGPADSSTMSTTDARERIINTLTHKGLKRHVLGTARVPDEIEEQLDAIEKYTDEYEQREASVREVISANVWTKLISIMEKKGDLTQVSTLTKMQTMICLEDDDVRAHLASMAELKEQLDGMGAPISDQSFAAMIRKSLPTSYRSLERSDHRRDPRGGRRAKSP